jgi:putative phage-type endonuclease
METLVMETLAMNNINTINKNVNENINVTDITNECKDMSIFTEEEEEILTETIGLLIDNIVSEDPLIYNNPDYKEKISEDIMELMEIQFAEHLNQENFEEFIPLIHEAFKTFHKYVWPKRSFSKTFIRKEPNITKMEKKINILKRKYQPEQKSNEWYLFRHNRLTASSVWKAFSSEATKNQLIYDKCKPFDIEKFNNVSTETPMHWGNKYEPVSIMFYEKHYNTKVDDYGCLVHDKYPFLAASPDGINNCPLSERYGRMLEIKNIVNRDINGIPKFEYWIQMQIQMEVCDLNECDFLETRFTEYDSREEFEKDGTFERTHDYDLKGVIMYFINDKKPLYEYAPLEITEEEFEIWEEEMMKKHENLTWLKNIYWKLEEISCVLVLRNKKWFDSAIPVIENLWKTIEMEKQEGFEHRAPKKKERKIIKNENEITGKCFIDISKLTENNNNDNNNDNDNDNFKHKLDTILDNPNVNEEKIEIVVIK